ncbi:hypothetical protein TRFO_28343 [Tritrichomonas foetus]|uniref:Uncharacterized protein n=1 Tax=Tritrichomonas foetus TaxID=1144522 RepID=A0A1J4JYJ1_9EUKA|nr:hypothetical protein TRFO_28343 [Tritrichomonas foetus]|eukprot:OHT04231.1 hypothetical protein TRFO_28343 [Tritrichomonas foetus]
MKGKDCIEMRPSSKDNFNKLGIRWRFYFFSSVYRNVCYNNHNLIFIVVVLDTFFCLIPLVSPQIHYFAGIPGKDNIWYADVIFDIFRPQAFDANIIILIFLLLYLVTLIVFIFCVMKPILIRRLHFVLVFPAHLFIFHFSAGIFGYCVHYLYIYRDDIYRIIISIVFIVVFALYFAFFTFLTYIESNSLIRPNPFYAEWFHGLTLFYPFWIFVVHNASFHIERIDSVTSRIVLYSLIAFISFLVAFEFMRIQPFLLFLMNDLQSSKSVVVGIYFIIAICLNFATIDFGPQMISAIVVIAISVFLILHLIAGKRRKSHEKIVKQLDDVENLNTDAIHISLSSISSQAQLNLVIKCGFTSGSRVITSFPFVRYCFERFPSSNWLLSYLVFLYGTVWGSDPNSYKFFLHMLSVERYHFVNELLLFQNIFCFMQIAENMSPIIVRYLEEYRWKNLILSQAHYEIWMKNIITTELNKFHHNTLNLCYSFAETEDYLKGLYAMFPFSPSVLFELSIYYADFKNDFYNASKFYDKATHLAQNSVKGISSELFHNFESAFPILMTQNEKHEKKSNEYDFLSLMEHHDRAQRQSNVFYTNDQYIKTLANHFSINQELCPQNVTYFRAETFRILVWSIIMAIGLLVLFGTHFYIRNALPNDKDKYNYILSIMNETVHFRQYLSMSEYDVMLILTIQAHRFENISRVYLRDNGETPPLLDDPFFWFAVSHLSVAEEITSSYKYYFEHLSEMVAIDKIYANNVHQENMTFFSLYEDFHTIGIMFVQSRSIMSENFNETNFYLTVQYLADIGNQVYKILADEMKELAEGTSKRYSTWFIGLIIADSIVNITFNLIYFYYTTIKMQNLFSIIRTIQRPALISIANRFNKVLLFKEHHIPTSHFNHFYLPLLYYAVSVIFLMITPIYFCIIAYSYSDYPINVDSLPNLPPIDNTTNFMYYTYAVVEYLIESNSTIMNNFNSDIMNDVYCINSICIHDLFSTVSDVDIYQYKFYDQMNTTKMKAVASITFIGCIIFFILFLWASIELILLYSVAHKMLHFIPIQASQTNPVLSQLQNDQKVSYQKMREFSLDLRKVPEAFNFFCAIYFDENDMVVKTIGNTSMIFKHNSMQTLVQISNYIITKGKHVEGSSFEQFFSEKQKFPVFFSLYQGSEFSMKFNSNTELFIKDETLNIEANQKRRDIQELNQSVEFVKPKAGLNTNQVILLIIDQIPDSLRNKLLKEWLKYKERIVRIDSRQHRYICLICINEKDSKETGLLSLQSFLKDIEFLHNEVKIALDFGGPIQIFDLSRCMMAKSRVVGKVYDRSLILASSLQTGKMVATQEFCEFIMLDNNVHYKDLLVTDEETIKITDICVDSIVR